MKVWRKISWACCAKCGSDAIESKSDVFLPEDWVSDSDELRCTEPTCKEKGWASVHDIDEVYDRWQYGEEDNGS